MIKFKKTFNHKKNLKFKIKRMRIKPFVLKNK